MKILIIANSSIVFGKELKNELTSREQEVSLLDFETLDLHSKQEHNRRYTELFIHFKKIPKLHMFFRMYLIAKLLKEQEFDCINIHYSRWVYLLILPTLRTKNYIITFYGSDFYRSSSLIKNLQRPLYQHAKALTFTNPLTKQSFLEFYNRFEEKSHVCRFGLKTLEYIDSNRDQERKVLQKSLGYSTTKTVVTCGYNATAAQQHFKMIALLESIDKKALENVQFIFPLTYGNKQYKAQVITRLKETTLDYLILDTFLYKDDNAAIKLASDIMINLLETDSFSGSMQEFLYADNLVITGSWLPYALFDQEGIHYLKIDTLPELSETLLTALQTYQSLKPSLQHNREIIYKLSSWQKNIQNWIDVYEHS